MTGHVTAPVAALADQLPDWVTLLRAPNPGPMTLDGTNTWVLRPPEGHGTVLVVDPGPADPGHLAAIAAVGPVSTILVTHKHPDHVEGLSDLVRLVWDPPTPPPGRTDPGWYRPPPPVHVRDPDTPSEPPFRLWTGGLKITELSTPGHTADSVCYLVERGAERVILTGDTILGRGTTVVAHPDGDLADYLDSLALLGAYQGIPALPGHGPALADCAAAARFYLAHRRARLDQVRQAVADGAHSPGDVVAVVYADVDRALWPAAEWSVRAQLAYLDRELGYLDREAVAPDRENVNPDREDREFGPGFGGLDLP